ncbi:winged helix DNA-binding protein [Microbacterium sp. LTA6]|uniref:MarR family winged helix-turn-helix transcriptional regulator n=1 Tax=Microbacterium sp. LTA6 TaxID=3129771 RepID=UPI003247A51A
MTGTDVRLPTEVGLLLHQVYALATKQLNAALLPTQLTSRHIAVMFLIRDGVQTQRDLVAHLMTDKTGMVRVVDDLARSGYITREQSAKDRRVTILHFTEAGQHALAEAQQYTQKVADDIFGAVDEQELTTMKETLARILDRHTARGD